MGRPPTAVRRICRSRECKTHGIEIFRSGARFRRPVVPGDQLRLEIKVLAWRGDFCKLEGKATVDGQLAAEAILMCKMVDREPETKASELKAEDAKK